jgi:hypothetical protein
LTDSIVAGRFPIAAQNRGRRMGVSHRGKIRTSVSYTISSIEGSVSEDRAFHHGAVPRNIRKSAGLQWAFQDGCGCELRNGKFHEEYVAHFAIDLHANAFSSDVARPLAGKSR